MVILNFDLDGVLVDYPNGVDVQDFLELNPIEGAVEAYKFFNEHPSFEVYILSTAPWSNPSAGWIREYGLKNT